MGVQNLAKFAKGFTRARGIDLSPGQLHEMGIVKEIGDEEDETAPEFEPISRPIYYIFDLAVEMHKLEQHYSDTCTLINAVLSSIARMCPVHSDNTTIVLVVDDYSQPNPLKAETAAKRAQTRKLDPVVFVEGKFNNERSDGQSVITGAKTKVDFYSRVEEWLYHGQHALSDVNRAMVSVPRPQTTFARPIKEVGCPTIVSVELESASFFLVSHSGRIIPFQWVDGDFQDAVRQCTTEHGCCELYCAQMGVSIVDENTACVRIAVTDVDGAPGLISRTMLIDTSSLSSSRQHVLSFEDHSLPLNDGESLFSELTLVDVRIPDVDAFESSDADASSPLRLDVVLQTHENTTFARPWKFTHSLEADSHAPWVAAQIAYDHERNAAFASTRTSENDNGVLIVPVFNDSDWWMLFVFLARSMHLAGYDSYIAACFLENGKPPLWCDLTQMVSNEELYYDAASFQFVACAENTDFSNGIGRFGPAKWQEAIAVWKGVRPDVEQMPISVRKASPTMLTIDNKRFGRFINYCLSTGNFAIKDETQERLIQGIRALFDACSGAFALLGGE